MPTIDVDSDTKRSVGLAARMADVSEGEIVRRLVLATATAGRDASATRDTGVSIFAEYEGYRTRAIYYAPGRIEIVDGPLQGQSFKSPTGAARAVVRHYNPTVNDNRNGWSFWQIDDGTGERVWLRSIRPTRSHDPQPNDDTSTRAVLRSFKNNGLRVVFVLLCVPKLVAAPYRDIAQASGTSLGTVHGVLTELQELGYVSDGDGARRLYRSRDLFKRWVSAYALDLYPRLKVAASTLLIQAGGDARRQKSKPMAASGVLKSRRTFSALGSAQQER